MRVLRNCRNFDWSAPVIVVEGLPVGQGFQVVVSQAGAVVDKRILGGFAGTLGYKLGCHIKFIDSFGNYCLGYYCTGIGVLATLWLGIAVEYLVIYAFIDEKNS